MSRAHKEAKEKKAERRETQRPGVDVTGGGKGLVMGTGNLEGECPVYAPTTGTAECMATSLLVREATAAAR